MIAPEKRNQLVIQLLNRTRAAAVRACKTPEGEYAKDTWDLVPFGHRGNLVFTKIGQPWLREAAKRWARDYLSTVRSRSTNSHVQQHLHGLASLSESLRARPDRGLDPAALARADIENWLNRTRFLQEHGRLGAATRWTYLRHVRHILRQVRALGLTRPGEPMAGLPDDFHPHHGRCSQAADGLGGGAGPAAGGDAPAVRPLGCSGSSHVQGDAGRRRAVDGHRPASR
ncbi:hypothetical protein [Actinoallomurus purpureus]|uniref:hypothetical protein n=1 Tax=Actinoallomurus purpureus TaxID=478114 RepID=UPI0020929927|nr:hypothetical protein [Actinoallomurus purpureus]